MTGEQPTSTVVNAGASTDAAAAAGSTAAPAPLPEAPAPVDASSTIDQPVDEEGHPRLARGVIAAALLLFAVTAGLLSYRSLTVPEPSAFLLVEGDESQDGIVVEVEGMGVAARVATLSRSNKYATRFPLPPGNYRVKLTSKEGRQIGGSVSVTLHEAAGALLPLSPAASSSTTTKPQKSKDAEKDIDDEKNRAREPAALETPALEKPAAE
jgi:hypothetical protein